MVESKTRSAEIQDVDPGDFAHFLEYAYRRSYTAPSWIEDSNVVEDEAPSPPESESESLLFERVLKHMVEESQTSARDKLQARFERLTYLPEGKPATLMIKNSVPQSNSAAYQDFTPVFLAHARLYTFADMRLVEPLKNLVLHLLHRTLRGFQLYNERVGDVIALVRYAYDNGKDREDDGTIEDLRKLVVEYIVYEVSTFGRHMDFVHLLEEGGQFVSDFWRVVSEVSLFD